MPELKGARCGELVVPEDRTKAGGRTLRLAVAIIPSETQPPSSDPIVFLTGGPGGDAVADPPIPNDVGINRNRDLILLSQRGTHSSQPALTCPEIDRFYARRVGLVYDAASTGDQYVQAVRACRDRLAPEADFAAFNSTESAYDLADLRSALGIDQWNVFSHSYGTDLALIYMRHDADGIRSVTLDGVAPPSAATPGWTWSSAKEAFDNMTNACVAQPACQTRYPNLAESFIRLVNQLEERPVTTTVAVPSVGDTEVVLDGGALLNWFVPLATHFPEEFPAAIDELARNNPRRIAELYAEVWANPERVGTMGWGLTLSVWCREWVPFESAEDQLEKAKRAFPEFPESVRAQAPQLPFLRDACAAWDVPKAPDEIRAVTESAIPTLVLSGSYDGQTGPQWGEYVAQHLSQSHVVTVPGVAHGVYTNDCGAKVIASFYEDPGRPDTSCVGATQPPSYEIIPPP
ncbi:alpha/beta fold hydrolase [Mycobacterium sp. 852002-51152_SCH6134967]|uniref:alpha/beta fold hydrolase n=1 Tax=Mycobacterium sp. 852002-51152_SCH6134967 TaxID=1834096 RepID=UPI001E3DF788|nr:alpha/beta hydrolase [Mycobacterium sp. 852002-51152_SCH6134967]